MNLKSFRLRTKLTVAAVAVMASVSVARAQLIYGNSFPFWDVRGPLTTQTLAVSGDSTMAGALTVTGVTNLNGGVSSSTGQVLAPDGTSSLPGIAFTADPDTGIQRSGSGSIDIISNTTPFLRMNGTLVMSSAATFGFSPATVASSADTAFARDAAGVMALKVGTTAQTLRIYGTTSGTKYLSLSHDGTNPIIDSFSGALKFGSTAVTPASSGTRYLCISTAGVITSSASACSGT